VVGYVPFSLWVIYKEGLFPGSGDISRLMMMMTLPYLLLIRGVKINKFEENRYVEISAHEENSPIIKSSLVRCLDNKNCLVI
jgi:hypothetical protein